MVQQMGTKAIARLLPMKQGHSVRHDHVEVVMQSQVDLDMAATSGQVVEHAPEHAEPAGA